MAERTLHLKQRMLVNSEDRSRHASVMSDGCDDNPPVGWRWMGKTKRMFVLCKNITHKCC